MAPFVLPLATGLAGLLLGAAARSRRTVVTVSAAAQILAGLYLLAETADGRVFALVPGGWSARLGIALSVDLFSALLITLSAVVSLACLLYSFAESPLRVEHPLRLSLMQFMLSGIQLAFTTADLFNLFVAFEVMLISSYALMTLEADDWEIQHAYPYVALNLVGSTLFICAAGLAYGVYGTLGFAAIAERAPAIGDTGAVRVVAVLLMLVFGLKAGLVPLHYWLPNSYPILPAPLAALYGGLLTKVGLYACIRVFGPVLPGEATGVFACLRALGAATLLVAVMGALARPWLRGILSFQVLSQAGLIALAVGLGSQAALAAAIFYVLHDALVKASMFLLAGAAARRNGSDHLAHMGHLARHAPLMAALFLLQALSLAGLPPFSGFWGKLAILQAALDARAPALALAVVAGSWLALCAMLRIWNGAFWAEPEGVELQPEDRRGAWMVRVAAGLVALSLLLGLGAGPMMRLASRAAVEVARPLGAAAALEALPGKDQGTRAP